jgi:hypothetical protein
MKAFLKIFTCLILFHSSSRAQDVVDSLRFDSELVKHKFLLMLDDIDFRLELQSLNKEIMLNTNPNTQWLWTAYAISNKETFQPEMNLNNMTSSLYQKYLEDSKFNPIRYVLGAMQTGAVAYLAYKHIKKYGFLKK